MLKKPVKRSENSSAISYFAGLCGMSEGLFVGGQSKIFLQAAYEKKAGFDAMEADEILLNLDANNGILNRSDIEALSRDSKFALRYISNDFTSPSVHKDYVTPLNGELEGILSVTSERDALLSDKTSLGLRNCIKEGGVTWGINGVSSVDTKSYSCGTLFYGKESLIAAKNYGLTEATGNILLIAGVSLVLLSLITYATVKSFYNSWQTR